MTHSDCYEKGHTPIPTPNAWMACSKCGGQPLFRVELALATVWHTQAELDRLWHGVDREAARLLSEEER